MSYFLDIMSYFLWRNCRGNVGKCPTFFPLCPTFLQKICPTVLVLSTQKVLVSLINNHFNTQPCNETEIGTIISKLGSNKASGPNSIPTNLLKEFSEFLVHPLKIIVNVSHVVSLLIWKRLLIQSTTQYLYQSWNIMAFKNHQYLGSPLILQIDHNK